MSRTTKWLLLATGLILAGCILFGGVMMALHWDFAKLSTVKYRTVEHAVTPFERVSIAADTANVSFVPSKDGSYSVLCKEKENATHSVTVENGTLRIEPDRTQNWYQRIGIGFGVPKITVTLPQKEYDAISVAVTTGKVTLSDLTCTGDVSVSVTTGNAVLTDISCKNFASTGSTGNLTMKNAVAAELLSIQRTTGNIRLDGCDGREISVHTTTGNVEGSLRTEKVFTTDTTTGKVSVPASTTGGKCDIRTTTGNIHLQVQ